MITRIWRGERLALSALPHAIREAGRYTNGDWDLAEAVLSVNKRWVRLTFEDGVTDYWHQQDTGEWHLSPKSPASADLRKPGHGGNADQPHEVGGEG